METEKPPVFGIVQRGGPIALYVLPDVQKRRILPIIFDVIKIGYTTIYTDEYKIYNDLEWLGYMHETVQHGAKEYARDADRDGFYEIHVNTMEGVWSLLRSWLRPHRGVAQENLFLYVGFFEAIYNSACRGIAFVRHALNLLLAPSP